MIKSFKYLFQFAWVNVGTILGFAGIVTLGAYATGVPGGADNLFRNYFGSFPFMQLVMVYIFAFALCTSNLNMALSFGARRRDFFWSIQGIILFYTLVCWGLQAVMAAIPVQFGWPSVDRWSLLMSLGGGPVWSYPLTLVFVMALGCLAGLVFVRSKVVGVIVMVVSVFFFIALLVMLLLASDLTAHPGLWGSLPWILPLALTAVTAVCEWFIWRTIKRSVVR